MTTAEGGALPSGRGRRAFLAAGMGAGAALMLSPRLGLAQGNRAALRLGLLGFGARGSALAAAARGLRGVEIVAVADPYAGRRVRAREVLGGAVAVAPDGAAVVDRPDVDAVLVATPDHLHAGQVGAALAAGKDVYCESPLTHAATEAGELERALAAGGAILTCSTGRPTSPLVERARELVQAGRLGRVTFASGSWHTSSALEAWLNPYPPDASPETVDFAAFQGGAPAHDFELARFFRWQRYWEYGTGLAGERFAPLLSTLHDLLGLAAPLRAQATGGVHRWQDGRAVPDTLVAGLEYEGGISVSLSASQNGPAGERLLVVGTEASLLFQNGELRLEPDPALEPYTHVGESWPEHYRSWFYMMHGLTGDGAPRDPPAVPRVLESYRPQPGAALEPGLAEFVASARSRRPPREGARHALDVAAAVHLVNDAYRADAARADAARPQEQRRVQEKGGRVA